MGAIFSPQPQSTPGWASAAPLPPPVETPVPPTPKGDYESVPVADRSLPPSAQGLLRTIGAGEAKDYNIRNGGKTFDGYDDHPGGHAGRYQFAGDTWSEIAPKAGVRDFTPESQDRAAWWLAQHKYQVNTGRDLQGDLEAGGHEPAVAKALRGTWVSLPGGSQSNAGIDRFRERLAAYTPRMPD